MSFVNLTRLRHAHVVFMLLATVVPSLANAQLISPGKLTTAHAELEGITNCTNCHALGEKGISSPKCLNCHEVIKNLVDAGRGYHANNARQSCATCHKEHFGREFELIRLDTLSFRHNDTGYPLIASHQDVACSNCHSSKFITSAVVLKEKETTESLERTYLGLPSTCATCHSETNPHGDQFQPRDCSSCHLERTFDEAPLFDHRRTNYPLTGQHQTVDCEGCHKGSLALSTGNQSASAQDIVEYVGVAFDGCLTCHADNHDGAMGSTCTTCHNTAGWNQINKVSFERGFNHSQTGFELVGKHAALACSSCHGKPARRSSTIAISFIRGTRATAYPHPQASECTSCHRDYHDGVFSDNPEGTACNTCHNEDGWQPSSFDINRHNELSRFELTGAHLATPCVACHQNPKLGHSEPVFQFERLDCESCHATDSKHGMQFADTTGITACQNCHITEMWTQVAFDHDNTGFPLLGAHALETCASCHTTSSVLDKQIAVGLDTSLVRYVGLAQACVACHSADSPHQGQFDEVACNTCHDVQSFRIESFDHEETNFPLTGGHENVACASCHKPDLSASGETFVRFKPLGTQCEDCHGADR